MEWIKMLSLLFILTAFNIIVLDQLFSDSTNKIRFALYTSLQPRKIPVSTIRRRTNIEAIENVTVGWKTFCEQNLKGNISLAKYVDKVVVKNIVHKYNLPIKIPKTYAFVTESRDITLEMINALPSEYVFKANHGSSMTVIVKGNSYRCYGFCKKYKYDGKLKTNQLTFLQTNCRRWLSIDYGKVENELYYSSVNRKCFFEEMIPQNDDYKIYVFHGNPALIDLHTFRFEGRRQAFYTPSWRKVDMKKLSLPTADVEKPSCLMEMLQIAKQLSRDFHFVRVDLYLSEKQIVFSELSISPGACKSHFSPSIAEKFYGFLAAGGNEDPESIISILQENKNKTKVKYKVPT
jgi:hypothetical protein